MMKMKLSVAISGMFVLSCQDDCHGSEGRDRAKVQEQQQHYQASQPLPVFEYSLERDLAIQLYKARNERVATWSVWLSEMGTIEGDCPSIGYPLPYDTSLTNPLQVMYNSSGAVVEQAEPNGLFASKTSTATWVRCVTKVNGEDVEAPVYIESKVTAYPYPVNVDYEKNRVTPVTDAKPSVVIEQKK